MATVLVSHNGSLANPPNRPMGGSGLVLYEAMVSAIAECARVDEIKDIRDKAMALEMYHKQARNTEAEIEAANVRLRAERRAGELLKDLARCDSGATRNPSGRAGKEPMSRVVTQVPASPYAAALEENGITRQTAHRYQRLAEVPKEVFEDALSGPEKPTAVRVIARSKVREAGAPVPKMSDEALWLWGRLRDFENKGFFAMRPKTIFAGMTDGMQSDVRRLAPLVSEFLSTLETQQ